MLWPETVSRHESGQLAIDGILLTDLAAEFGTPLYVIDAQTLRNRARSAVQAFTSRYPDVEVVYAGKAGINRAVLRLLRDEGLGFDVVSGGELHAVLAAGIDPAKVTFHGNYKSREELEAAIDAGIGLIAIDNLPEIDLLDEVATNRGKRIAAILRLNPGIDVHTHGKIATGVVDSKFGLPLWTGDAEAGVVKTLASRSIDLIGYHCHLGSQLSETGVYQEAVTLFANFATDIRDRHGFIPRVISPGGGPAIAYLPGDPVLSFDDWADVVVTTLTQCWSVAGLPLPKLVVEPGRSIVGPAGLTIYRVGSRKPIEGVRTYVSVDGGMADNIRPALYGAKYHAELANRIGGGATETVTIAGRFCESGDILIEDIKLPRLEPGDLLALPVTGAYCLAMASNYNLALRPAVVMVENSQARLIRRRETNDDLLRFDVET